MSFEKIILNTLDTVRRPFYGEKNNSENSQNVKEVKEVTIPGKDEIVEIVDKLNNTVKGHEPKISFSYHEKINRVIMKIIDSDTNEVVREIPAKDVVKLLENLNEYIGVFFDESR